VLNPLTDTEYTVNATIQDCPAPSVTANVVVIPSPVIEIVANPSGEVFVGTSVSFSAQLLNSSGDETFEWFYNGTSVGTGDSVQITILEVTLTGGQNLIEVFVINEFGCTGFDELEVVGIIPVYQLPNIFTPDGDGVNDFFNLTYKGQDENSNLGPAEIVRFTVWNRWGNTVYNNETPNQGWDGTHKGDPAPSDVYVYMIQIKLPNGTIVTIDSNTGTENTDKGKNDVTLIR